MKKDKIMGTKRWLYWVSIGTVLAIIYKLLDNFTGIGEWLKNLITVISPFLIAILMAYILYTPCMKIEKVLRKHKVKKGSRVISIAIVYTIFVVAVYLILIFILPAIINSIIDLVNNAQIYYNRITANEIDASWVPFVQENILKPTVDYIQKIDFKEMLTPDKILNYVISAIGLFKIVINVLIAFVCSIYILSEREQIIKFIDNLAKATLSTRGYSKFNRYFTKGNVIFFDFISSQVIDGFIVAILMSILLIFLKVKYAIALGVIIGIFNLIPYFGAIIAIVVAALITILTGGWQQALWMTIAVIIVQQIDANIINPRITGTKLKISPLLVVFSVTVGGAYFGVIGMFLAVPVAVLIKLMLEDYIENKKEEKKVKVEEKE